MAISRPAKRAVVGEGLASAVPDPAFKTFPLVWGMLSDVRYDDGSTRELSALSFFLEDGVAKVALNDREEKRSLYASGECLRGCLEALEAMLGGAGADWRAWGKNAKRK